MKKIVVGFSRSKKSFPVFSWLIRLYQWTKFSHTYIRLSFGVLPSDNIIHASEGVVQNMSETIFNKKHEVTDEFEVYIPDIIVKDRITKDNLPLYRVLYNILHETSGDDYSIMQNVGIVYVDIMRYVFKKEVKNPWTAGWNCSEFVAIILRTVYPSQFKELDVETITPKQVYQILKELSEDERFKIQKIKKNNK